MAFKPGGPGFSSNTGAGGAPPPMMMFNPAQFSQPQAPHVPLPPSTPATQAQQINTLDTDTVALSDLTNYNASRCTEGNELTVRQNEEGLRYGHILPTSGIYIRKVVLTHGMMAMVFRFII